MILNCLAAWRAKRSPHGINKAHLGRQLGVSRSYIAKLENGTAQPSAELMFRAAQYFGSRIEDIFSYVADTKPWEALFLPSLSPDRQRSPSERVLGVEVCLVPLSAQEATERGNRLKSLLIQGATRLAHAEETTHE